MLHQDALEAALSDEAQTLLQPITTYVAIRSAQVPEPANPVVQEPPPPIFEIPEEANVSGGVAADNQPATGFDQAHQSLQAKLVR